MSIYQKLYEDTMAMANHFRELGMDKEAKAYDKQAENWKMKINNSY